MTREELLHQLQHGIEMARDPRNAHVRGADALRVTTLYSPWLLQICLKCRHTFRENDRVRPDPMHAGRMVHDDAQTNLFCWSKAQGIAPARADVVIPNEELRSAFLRGLQAHWQPAGNVCTVIVEPRSALIGRKCPICRHTVRAGDTVVHCPCGRGCGGVFHQDPMRHLTCWDTWNCGANPTYCAFTGAPFAALPEAEL